MNDLWQPVIGLEIHVQLNTRTKLFSSAPNCYGDEPNTNITTVCTGQPGSLPVLNKEAVRKAVQFGLAAKGRINLVSRFDRKSYFYPDSPRNYQITQFERPLITGGTVIADVEGVSKSFAIAHAHLEDDAGTIKHFSNYAGIDYNRAGAPLIEIVSEPCMHSAKEASAFAMALRSLMLYLDASDCNMEEGSFRIDINISVRPVGETALRPRVEIKNMNSFHFLEQAIHDEVRRQIALYNDQPHTPHEELIPFCTYRWQPDKKGILPIRKKEKVDDYRIFPDPDLVPLVLTQDFIDWVESSLPELPHERYRRYLSDLGLSPHSANILVNDKALCDYFEKALSTNKNPRLLCNWLTVEFTGHLREKGKTLYNALIPPTHFAKLVRMIDERIITGRIAKSVIDDMIDNPTLDPIQIVKNNPDYLPMSAAHELEPLILQVLKEHPQSVADFRAGKDKALGFLVGQVMKLSRGSASPQIVHKILQKKIKE